MRVISGWVYLSVLLVGCSSGSEAGQSVGTDPGAATPLPSSVVRPAASPPTVPAAPSAPAHPSTPGEVIVQFRSDGQRAVSQCVQTALAQHRALKDTTLDASSSLDGLASRFSLKAAHALFPARVGLTTQVARTFLAQRMTAAARNLAPLQQVDPGDLVNTYLLEVDKGQDVAQVAAAFQADPHVAFAQPNYEMKASYMPNDPYLASSGSFGQPYADLWDMLAIGAPAAWDTSRGAGVIVAVVDSGVDLTHPDLVGNLWQNPHEIPNNGIDDDGNGYIDDVAGWSYISNSGNPMDQNGHGTHVAGTIAAQDNNGIGIVGVAPDARIMPIQALDFTGSGSTFGLAQGMLYAAENGASVINNSWGCGSACPESPLVEQATKTAHDLGSVVVFAAGNASASTVGFAPENGPYAVVVGATDPNDFRASFSNFGLLDVTAPGAGLSVSPPSVRPDYGILSLRAANCGFCSTDLVVGGQYVRLGGTSMAAPHVAGLAALIRAQHPEYSVEQVRQVIRHSALDLGLPGYDSDYGYGRIHAGRAMVEPAPLEVLITTPAIVRAASIPLTGIVRGSALASYTLDFGTDGSTWTAIASGTTAVNDASLGSFNSSALADGPYWLRLTARTTDGRSYEDRQVVTLDRIELTAPANQSVIKGGGIITIQGTAMEPSMTWFKVVVLRTSDSSVVSSTVPLTGGGTSPVQNGVLATWDTAGLADDFYTIYLDVLSPTGFWSTNTTVLVESTLHQGFPYQLNRITQGQGQFGDAGLGEQHTYADVDGDGKPELVLAHNKEVVILRNDGTPLPGWPQRIDTNGTIAIITRAPAVGDIDGDGSPEIVAGNDRGRLFAWHKNGTLVSGWPRQIIPDLCGDTGCAAPENISVALADIDHDGTLDIVSATRQGQLHVQHANGSELPGFPWVLSPNSAAVLSDPAIADLDGDGYPEIAFTTQFEGQGLYVLNHLGHAIPGFPVNVEGSAYPEAPAIGDIDGDGAPEIVLSTNYDVASVVAYHRDASLVSGWPRALPSTLGSFVLGNVVLGDVTGDGRLEVVVGSQRSDATSPFASHGELFVKDASGNDMPGFPIVSQDLSAGVRGAGYGGITLSDVDADGVADIVTAEGMLTYGASVTAFKGNGSEITSVRRKMLAANFSLSVSPSAVDLNGDGKLELSLIDNTGLVYTWDLGTADSGVHPWPMFAGNARHQAYAPVTSGQNPAAQRIEAENYVRHFESTPTINYGAAGSPQCDRGDGVDIEATADNNGRCNIGWTQPGEWLEYDVAVPSTGDYTFTMRATSGVYTSSFRVEIDGVSLGSRTPAQTGFQTFQDIKYFTHLSAGTHNVRVVFETTDVNLNYFLVAPSRVQLPARIQAQDYLRHFDTTPSINYGAAGSPHCDQKDGVDIELTLDNLGRCNIGWTQPGEWLEYDVTAPSSGNYSFAMRTASASNGTRLHLEIDGVNLGSRTLPQTNWQAFTDTNYIAQLSAGSHTLRVVFETQDVNFNYITIEPVLTVPTRVQAESYVRFFESDTINTGAADSPQCDRGDGVDAQSTNDNGGICNIGWTAAGEWLEYDIARTPSGGASYSMTLRVASGSNGSLIKVDLDGVNLGQFAVPNLGWQSFTDLHVPVAALPNPGNLFHTVRVEFPTGLVNLNYIDFP